MKFKRSSGIILHPSSLPGPDGIGDLGSEAYRWVEFLEGCGCSLWQVLPLGPTGYGDSPYQCFSAFAGNPYLISPELLIENGLLTDAELIDRPDLPEKKVDYGQTITWKLALLDRAFKNCCGDESGPILQQVIRQIIRKQIKASPTRILRHLVNKTGYPVITPQFTYSKVPVKAAGLGLLVRPLPLGPANSFQLDPAEIENALERQDGLVYLPSPNNPTGTMMIGRDDLLPLLRRFPESRFWIDEAYVQYVEPNGQGYLADLVPQHPNLFVSRSFSFAYGLAAIRVGYMVGAPDIVKEMRGQLVEYYIGRLQEDLVVAALNDEHHLPFIRRECRKQAKLLRAALDQLPGVETYPTLTNFILCRLSNGRKAKDVSAAMGERGIRIKAYEPIGEGNEGEYFRITLGIAEENSFLQATLREVLSERS